MKKILLILVLLTAFVIGCTPQVTFQDRCTQNDWVVESNFCNYGSSTAPHFFKWSCNDGNHFVFYYSDKSEYDNYAMSSALRSYIVKNCGSLETK